MENIFNSPSADFYFFKFSNSLHFFWNLSGFIYFLYGWLSILLKLLNNGQASASLRKPALISCNRLNPIIISSLIMNISVIAKIFKF